PHLACRRVGEILQGPDALLELVERRGAAVHHGAGVDRRLDATRAAFEQWHAKRLLEVGDDLGYSRLGDAELCSGLGHAAALRDGQKNVEMPQADAAADLMLGVEFVQHPVRLTDGTEFCNLKVYH